MTYPAILDLAESCGYTVFKTGNLNLNIIGVRTPSREANKFDDRLHLVYKEDGTWQEHVYAITTDPGTYWLANPMCVEGTAILAPGQYRGAYTLGKHRGSYDALVQIGDVAAYRDGNKDNTHDRNPDTIQVGRFGINIHRASSVLESSSVNKWSAGCQVFASPTDFAEFLGIVKTAASIWGSKFSYTLIEE
jgi:hypothetical protein